MLTNEEFERLASRLGREAVSHPRRYRARVTAFGVLGYVYVFGVLVVLLTLVAAVAFGVATRGGAVLVAKLAIPVVILWFIVLKSLWVRVPPPEGVELTRAEAPRLFAEVHALRERLRVPRIHTVLANDDFNAAVAQVPRLGAFGWHRNYLVVGVPLMWALSRDEFRAVLAHELGHLSRAHGRTSAWIYRIRERWSRVLTELEQHGSGLKVILERFFDWYAPRFAAYTYALARAHEFEADRHAALIAGREPAAAALKRIAVLGRHLGERHWPEVWRTANTVSEPLAEVHMAFIARLAEPEPPAEAAAWLADALAETTTGVDTHPALAERLQAVGDPEPHVLPHWHGAADNAAEHYLGEHARRLTTDFEARWREQAAATWTALHQRWTQLVTRLDELDAKATSSSLSVEEQWEHAQASGEVRGAKAALPLLRKLIDSPAPIGPAARFTLGRLLLEADDAAGLEHVETALQHDRGFTLAGCELAIAYLTRAGRAEEAAPFRARLEAYGIEVEKAQAERTPDSLTASDVLLPHALDDATLEAIVAQLRERPDIRRAYLARKQVKHLPEVPLYVIGVEPGVSSEAKIQQLINWLASEVSFPGDAVIVPLLPRNEAIAKRLKQVAGSQILPAAMVPAGS